MKRSALFLDRDGVINEDRRYVHNIEDFYFIEGIFDLCRRAKSIGMLIMIVTNQAGIGRGYYTEEQFHFLSDWMVKYFANEGIQIDGIYFCPFHPEHGIGRYKINCKDRKPEPGMIYRACDEHALDLESSVLIGDKKEDIQAAQNAGIGTSVLFSGKTIEMTVQPDLVSSSLIELTELLFP